MANGMPALAPQRHGRSRTGSSWQTVSIPAIPPRRYVIDGRWGGGDDGAGNSSRLDDSVRIVGGGLKRGFDIAAALTAILLLLPMFCLIALAIKMWDRGPIFYRHRRIGLRGTSFECLKFRSMVM